MMKVRRALFLFGSIAIATAFVLVFSREGQPLRLRLSGLPKTSIEVKLGSDLEVNMSKTQSMQFVWVEDLKMWVGKYEVTFGQYGCAYSPARLFIGHGIEDHADFYVDEKKNVKDHPAVMISWKGAKKYCNWLNKHYRDRLPRGYQFRMPTEEEWESFARCGDNRIYPWGGEWPPQKMKDGIYPNYQGEEHRWIGEENVSKPKPNTIRRMSGKNKLESKIIPNHRDGWKSTCPVQKSGMNAWGLYGVGGNVCEWCEGWHPTKKGIRIMKGAGCYNSYSKHLKIVNKSVKESYGGAIFIPIPFLVDFLKRSGKNTGHISSGFRVVIGKGL